MRCYECGHINQTGVVICIKCGTKLSSESIPATPKGSSNDASFNRTIIGRQSDTPAWDERADSNAALSKSASDNDRRGAFFTCSQCSYYPLKNVPSTQNPCVNCGSTGDEIDGRPTTRQEKNENKSNPEIKRNLHAEPTEDRLQMKAKTMKIGAINLQGEKPKPKVILRDESNGELYEFNGDNIVLNRSNLDKNNPSISSKEHAELHISENKIFVEDKSSNQATFLQVVEKTEIKPNSHLVIGNKVYSVTLSE